MKHILEFEDFINESNRFKKSAKDLKFKWDNLSPGKKGAMIGTAVGGILHRNTKSALIGAGVGAIVARKSERLRKKKERKAMKKFQKEMNKR